MSSTKKSKEEIVVELAAKIAQTLEKSLQLTIDSRKEYFETHPQKKPLPTDVDHIISTYANQNFVIAAGVIGGIGQILVTSAYRFAPASVLAPFDYSQMLFAVAAGYLLFAEIPTAATIWGSLVVIAAGVLIIWRERQLGLERGKARSKMGHMG